MAIRTIARASIAVIYGLEVTPTPSSSHVRTINNTRAGQTLRNLRATLRLRLLLGCARRHRRRRTSQVAMASHGQTAHQAEPRKNMEIIRPVHQIFQVNTVAIFLSGIWEPDKPAAMISINRHTAAIFNNNNRTGVPVMPRTNAPRTGMLARLIVFAAPPGAGFLNSTLALRTNIKTHVARTQAKGSPGWVIVILPCPGARCLFYRSSGACAGQD